MSSVVFAAATAGAEETVYVTEHLSAEGAPFFIYVTDVGEAVTMNALESTTTWRIPFAFGYPFVRLTACPFMAAHLSDPPDAANCACAVSVAVRSALLNATTCVARASLARRVKRVMANAPTMLIRETTTTASTNDIRRNRRKRPSLRGAVLRSTRIL